MFNISWKGSCVDVSYYKIDYFSITFYLPGALKHPWKWIFLIK